MNRALIHSSVADGLRLALFLFGGQFAYRDLFEFGRWDAPWVPLRLSDCVLLGSTAVGSFCALLRIVALRDARRRRRAGWIALAALVIGVLCIVAQVIELATGLPQFG